eukprot:CFRG8559T1
MNEAISREGGPVQSISIMETKNIAKNKVHVQDQLGGTQTTTHNVNQQGSSTYGRLSSLIPVHGYGGQGVGNNGAKEMTCENHIGLPTEYYANNCEYVSSERNARDITRTDVDKSVFMVAESDMEKRVGVTMSFEALSYTVKVGKKTKTILKDLTGMISGGSLSAVMGSTGGGKSTLLDVLAGRKDAKAVSGAILVDGIPATKQFNYTCGYVQQDDTVMGTLTVTENLMFSARLRLSPKMPDSEKRSRVQSVIRELGLSKVADSLIGTRILRGVSGGERKRVCIGMELVKEPSVLFLDEPTTGLDSNTAENLLFTLKELTEKGQTIILSIHQPRYSIFKLFDSLFLLSAGEFVYAGPACNVTNYFAQLGHDCEPHNNPADFLLDVTNAECLRMMNGIDADKDYVALAEHYKQSAECAEQGRHLTIQRHNTLMSTLSSASSRGVQKDLGLEIHTVGFFTQVLLVGQRALRNSIRNPETSIMQVASLALFGLITGTVFFQFGDEGVDALQNRVGAMFFILLSAVFSNMSAIAIFIEEREIFINEKMNGYYRTEAYFLAKTTIDLVFMRVLPVAIFTTISYFMCGFQADPISKYLIVLLSVELVAKTAAAICFFVSCGVSTFALAHLIVTLIYVIMMAFGGLLVNVSTMPAWMQWVKWTSIFMYGMEILESTELDGKF